MTGTEVKPPQGTRTAPRRAPAKRGAAPAAADGVAVFAEPVPEAEAAAVAPAAAPALADAPEPVAEARPLRLPVAREPASAVPRALAFGGIESVAAFGTAHLGALIRANAVFAGGVEAISLEVFGQARASFTSVAAVATAMLGARTLKDVVELNAGFAQAQCETLVANASRLAELTLKVATETAAPLAAQAASPIEHRVHLPA